ncbi:hypothetical protein DZC78_04310 [Olleya aquimaris]|nr:hypothetical protein DZC78_04310 [Olleya aquimaris]
MPSIFKEDILPNLNLKTLEASEQQVLITILELLDITDSKVYKDAKGNASTKTLSATFTNTLAQQLYNHPKLYSNTQQGITFVMAWLPLVKQGFFPDKKSTELFIHFLKFNLNYFESEHCQQTVKNQIFEVIKLLSESTSEASIVVNQFLIDSIFDLTNIVNSDFLIQQCIQFNILNSTYSANQNKDTLDAYPFKINDTFIKHFFNNDWSCFITEFHQILPVGHVYKSSAYTIISNWLSSDLADYYANNTQSVLEALEAIKERWIFAEVKSTALLHLKTNNNHYPFINALGTKTWDSGDVILFSDLNKGIPQNLLDQCYQQFLEWLSINKNLHFNTEVFTDFAKPLLQLATASVLPLTSLAFWFNTCHPKSGIKSQTETYNAIFSKLLLDDNQNALPCMRYQNETFKLTGPFVITHVFQNTNNLDVFLKGFQNSGISNSLNQFLVRVFYDANQELFNLYNKEQLEALQIFLLELAYSATQTEDAIKTQNLPFIVNTLSILCAESGNFTRVNQIWALKDIDPCITTLCNTFAAKHYLNPNTPLTLNQIQAWFSYLSDYYYSFKQEAIWVNDMLTTQGVRTANFFNKINDDVSYFLDKVIKNIITIHQKSKKTEIDNDATPQTWVSIEVFLMDFLDQLKTNKLNANTVRFLFEYCKVQTNGFTSQDTLNNSITTLNNLYFNTKPEADKSNTSLNTVDIKMQPNEINQKFVEFVLSNLEQYPQTKIYDTEALTFLLDNITEFKVWLQNDPNNIRSRLSQALYMTLLDTNLASDAALATFTNLCKTLFVQLVKGTKMASSYAMGLKTMVKSGAYPEDVSTVLSQVAKDIIA